MVVTLPVQKHNKARPRPTRDKTDTIKCAGCGSVLMTNEQVYRIGKLRQSYVYRGFKIDSKRGYSLRYFGDCCVNQIYVDGGGLNE